MEKKKMKPVVKMTGKLRGTTASRTRGLELKAAPLPLSGEMADAAYSVERCVNLRRHRESGNLVAAGCPVHNSRLASLPLKVMAGGEGLRVAVVASGNRLRVEYPDGGQSGYDIGGVAGTVREIVMTAPTRGVVMTDKARYVLARDSGGRWGLSDSRVFPALQFEAVDVMRMSADSGERELTGTYDTRSIALNDADTDRLTKDLLRCYRDLVDKTVRSGLELQPLLARYRLEGEDGEVLYRSPVVQVGAPSGVQCVSELRCELGTDRQSRGVLRVAADVYRLRLRQTGTNVVQPGTVRRLVVETSLPVHPVNPSLTAANALTQNGTNGVTIRCFLPGASVTMVSSRRRAVSQLRELAMKGDSAFRDALVVHNPFDGDEPVDVAVTVPRGAVEGVDAEIEAAGKVLAADVEKLPQMVARCRVPNSFLAATGCRAGDCVVWGDITAIPFEGYRIEEFVTATTADGVTCPWRAVVVTELACGSRCVATSWGQSRAPLSLSPMLCAARADAVSMTVIIERDGSVYKGVYPLSPDAAGLASYYCDPDGRAIEPEPVDEAFAYVSDGRVAERYPSGLLVTSSANPFDGVICEFAGRGNVTATAVVDRRGSSWEFGRQRAYALTDEGIYLLSIGTRAADLRCNRLDRRGVASAAAMAETDDDRYPLVCVAGGDLLGLSRGNAVTLEEGVKDCAIGWDRTHKELWLADADGHARVKESPAGGWREVGGLSVTAFRDGGSGLLIGSNIGIRDTALGEAATTEMAYTLRCDMPALDWYRSGMQVRCAGAQVRSANVSGAMSVVSRDIDAGEPRMLAAMEFRGTVNSPLVMGLCGCTGPVVDVSIAGEMDAGGELRELRLELTGK